MDVAVGRLRGRRRRGHDDDRGQRRAGRLPLAEAEPEDEQRHDHRPAPDPEQPAEQPRRGADHRQRRIGAPWHRGRSYGCDHGRRDAARRSRRSAGTRCVADPSRSGGPARHRRHAGADRAPRRRRARPRADPRPADRVARALRPRGLRQRPPGDHGAADRLAGLDHLRRQPRRRAAARRRDRAGARPRGRGQRADASAPSPTREWNAEDLRRLRVRGEDKDVICAFHWRGAPDEDAAEAAVREVAARAEAEGLVTHWGRKVLEVRPPVELHKGRGVRRLLQEVPTSTPRCTPATTAPTSTRSARCATPWPTARSSTRCASACAPRRRPRSSRPRPTSSSTAPPACAACSRRSRARLGRAVRFVDLLRATVLLSAGAATTLGGAHRRGRDPHAGRPPGHRRLRLVGPRRAAAAPGSAAARPPRRRSPGCWPTRDRRAQLPEHAPRPARCSTGCGRCSLVVLAAGGRGPRGPAGRRRSPPASCSSGRWPGGARRRR